ncbi:MAG: hypothetical protein ACI4LC_00665 [Emergencia sp.]
MKHTRKFKAIVAVFLIASLIMQTAAPVSAADSLSQQPADGQYSSQSLNGNENMSDNMNDSGSGDAAEPNQETEAGTGENPGTEPEPEPVPLEKPEFTRHTVTKGYYLQLQWTEVENVSKYVVQRQDPGSNTWKTLSSYAPGTTKRTGTGKLAEGRYSYRVKAVSIDPKLYTDSVSDPVTVCYLGTSAVTTDKVNGRVRVDWSPVQNATGYYIYRKKSQDDDWTYIKTVSGINSTSFYDDGADDGTFYYCVKAISGSTTNVDRNTGAYGGEDSVDTLGWPEAVDFVKRDSGDRVIRWSRSDRAEGYEVEYGLDRLFIDATRVSLTSDESTYIVSGIPGSKSFFARVRAFRTVDGKKEYSKWQNCQNSGSTGYATYERVEYMAGGFDIKARAGQSLYYYDTVQGGCTDGTYAYYALNRRTVDNCKIVKMRLSDNKIVMVSDILAIDHGNGMAYNPDTNELIVNNCTGNPKRLTVINPDTLKIKKKVDVSIPQNMTGASNNEGTGITGFSSITYNQKRGVYVALTKGRTGFLMMDKKFNVIEYMPLDYKTTGKLWQCLDSTDEYLLIAHSPNGNAGNIIAIYDWEGRYVTSIRLLTGYELENIYHVGTQFYATYYLTGYSSGQLYRKNYIFKFDLTDERVWVKTNVAKPTKPYTPKSPAAIKPKASAKTASVKMTWNKASYGTGYKIYRAESKNGKFELVATIDNLDTVSYTDKNLDRKKTYYYKIRSYKTSYGKTYYSSYTTVKSVKTL